MRGCAPWSRALALALVLPAPALAQVYQCRPPKSLSLPDPPQPDGPVTRTPITSYILAITWTPELCRDARAASDPGNFQCNRAIGRFGFVLHGLWPESGQGRYPQWCATRPRPRPEDFLANLCMTPQAWLLEHEWAKHGSCFSPGPAAYFNTERALWSRLHWPDAARLSNQEHLTAGDLRRAFTARNPGWPISAVGLALGNGGWLRELRLCYSSRLTPAPCESHTFGAGNDAPVRIWQAS